MVAAAHIKPLDKEDKNGMLSGQGVSGRNQPWNPFSTKGKDRHQTATGSSQDIEKVKILNDEELIKHILETGL